jgi:glycosyltransferase involved in cell wall biosynthesis
MRILLASDDLPPKVGGAGKAAWILARGLRDRGHEVHVVTAVRGAPPVEDRAGVRVHAIRAEIPERWRAYLSLHNPPAVRAFREILEAVRPDVVNAHNVHLHLSYGCLSAAARIGIPVVFTAHDVMTIAYGKLQHYVDPQVCPTPMSTDYRLPSWHNLREARFRFNPFRNLWIRHALRRHVRVRVAVSQALRLALEANGLSAFRVVHNGIAGDEWGTTDGAVDELRHRLRLNGRKVLLLAGRINEAKGSLQAFAALAQVVERVPSAALLVLSDRPVALGEFGELAREHICFGGWLTGRELAAAYGMAEVVITPSVCLDVFPMVNLEAMAARKPVIATCHGGSPEIVQDGVTGYVINPFDTPQFAGRLVDVLSDTALQTRLGEAGYQRFLDEFTMERFAERMSAIFDEVVA